MDIFKFWVMLTSAPKTLVKKVKNRNFNLKTTNFGLLKS